MDCRTDLVKYTIRRKSDGDGNVTLADLARLQQYLSKKIESL